MKLRGLPGVVVHSHRIVMIVKITQIRTIRTASDDAAYKSIPGLAARVMIDTDRQRTVPNIRYRDLWPSLVGLSLPPTAVINEPLATAEGIGLITDPAIFPDLPRIGNTVCLPFRLISSRHRIDYNSKSDRNYDMIHGGIYGNQDVPISVSSEQFAPVNLTNMGRPIIYAPLENLSSTNPASNLNVLPLYETNKVPIPKGFRSTTSIIRGTSLTDVGTRIINRRFFMGFNPIQLKNPAVPAMVGKSHEAFLISEYEVELDNSVAAKISTANSKLYAVWNVSCPRRNEITTTPDADGNIIGYVNQTSNVPTARYNCVSIGDLVGGSYRESFSDDLVDVVVDGIFTPDPTEYENRLEASVNTGPSSEIIQIQ